MFAKPSNQIPSALDASLSAAALAALLPKLTLEARHTASIVGQGMHGRRQAGQGEQFYEFRRYQNGEPAARIDWRRSARQQRLYVREREWESRHTVYISCDFSPSMAFSSTKQNDTKLKRSLHMGLALAALCLQAGERVAALSTPRPRAGKSALGTLAQELISGHEHDIAKVKFKPHSDLVVISDFLDEQALETLFRSMETARLRPILVQMIDMAENLFPYTGHNRFIDPETGDALRFGEAQSVRVDYQSIFKAHKDRLRQLAVRHGGVYLSHQTDQPPAPTLLALFQAIAQSEGYGQ